MQFLERIRKALLSYVTSKRGVPNANEGPTHPQPALPALTRALDKNLPPEEVVVEIEDPRF